MATASVRAIFTTLSFLLLASFALASNNYVDSVDIFSGRFFKEASNQPKNKGKNVVVSGLSADIVMNMVAFGAEGETKKQITDALAIDDLTTMTPQIQKTLQEINNTKGVTLNLADKAYFKKLADGKVLQINPSYRQSIQDIFLSEVDQLDFSHNVESAKVINEWVESKTNNRIKDLIDPSSISGDTAAVLCNAIFFKGNWKVKFFPNATKTEKFTMADGTTMDVEMMNKQDKLKYKDSPELDAKIVELPYEKDETSMVIILPNKVNGINDLPDKLVGGVNKYLDGMYESEVRLKLPKFTIETEVDVQTALENLGVKKVFQSDAELRNILSESTQLSISSAVQKAFIEVTEEGAEAAAATVVEVEDRIGSPSVFMPVVHPFFYQIKRNDVTIFSGIVQRP